MNPSPTNVNPKPHKTLCINLQTMVTTSITNHKIPWLDQSTNVSHNLCHCHKVNPTKEIQPPHIATTKLQFPTINPQWRKPTSPNLYGCTNVKKATWRERERERERGLSIFTDSIYSSWVYI